jgi:hypothetical protein
MIGIIILMGLALFITIDKLIIARKELNSLYELQTDLDDYLNKQEARLNVFVKEYTTTLAKKIQASEDKWKWENNLTTRSNSNE